MFTDGDGDNFGAGASVNRCGTAAGAAPTGFSLVGTDCCDTDLNAFPGQTAYFTGLRGCGGGYDYNCNGADNLQFTAGFTGCTHASSCGVPAYGYECVTTGFTPGWANPGGSSFIWVADATPPACGAMQSWVNTCNTWSGVFACGVHNYCNFGVITQTQGCR